MKEDQKAIYYLAADTITSAKSAPFLEELVQRDIEVLFLVEPIDEVAVTNLQSYKDKKFVDISKEDLELGDVDEDKEKENEKEYRLLCDWMKQNLGDKVAKVTVSKRISSSPCVLVSGKFGWSANMERIMKAQTLGDNSQMEFMRGRRILEINPNHPIIQDLNSACKDTPRNPRAQAMANLLYETALLSSGFTPENPAEFGARVYEMMGLALAGQNNAAANKTEETSSSEGSSEVVEASEVLTENDPWQS
jgi:heat shock protein beta